MNDGVIFNLISIASSSKLETELAASSSKQNRSPKYSNSIIELIAKVTMIIRIFKHRKKRKRRDTSMTHSEDRNFVVRIRSLGKMDLLFIVTFTLMCVPTMISSSFANNLIQPSNRALLRPDVEGFSIQPPYALDVNSSGQSPNVYLNKDETSSIEENSQIEKNTYSDYSTMPTSIQRQHDLLRKFSSTMLLETMLKNPYLINRAPFPSLSISRVSSISRPARGHEITSNGGELSKSQVDLPRRPSTHHRSETTNLTTIATSRDSVLFSELAPMNKTAKEEKTPKLSPFNNILENLLGLKSANTRSKNSNKSLEISRKTASEDNSKVGLAEAGSTPIPVQHKTLDMLIKDEFDSRIQPMVKYLNDQQRFSSTINFKPVSTSGPSNHKTDRTMIDSDAVTTPAPVDPDFRLTTPNLFINIPTANPAENVMPKGSDNTLNSEDLNSLIADYYDDNDDEPAEGPNRVNLSVDKESDPSQSSSSTRRPQIKPLSNVPPYELSRGRISSDDSYRTSSSNRAPQIDNQSSIETITTDEFTGEKIKKSARPKVETAQIPKTTLIFSDGDSEAEKQANIKNQKKSSPSTFELNESEKFGSRKNKDGSKNNSPINEVKQDHQAVNDVSSSENPSSSLLNKLFSTIDPLRELDLKLRERSTVGDTGVGDGMFTSRQNPLIYKGYVGGDDYSFWPTTRDWSKPLNLPKTTVADKHYPQATKFSSTVNSAAKTDTSAPPMPYNHYVNRPVTNAQSVPSMVIPTSDPPVEVHLKTSNFLSTAPKMNQTTSIDDRAATARKHFNNHVPGIQLVDHADDKRYSSQLPVKRNETFSVTNLSNNSPVIALTPLSPRESKPILRTRSQGNFATDTNRPTTSGGRLEVLQNDGNMNLTRPLDSGLNGDPRAFVGNWEFQPQDRFTSPNRSNIDSADEHLESTLPGETDGSKNSHLNRFVGLMNRNESLEYDHRHPARDGFYNTARRQGANQQQMGNFPRIQLNSASDGTMIVTTTNASSPDGLLGDTADFGELSPISNSSDSRVHYRRRQNPASTIPQRQRPIRPSVHSYDSSLGDSRLDQGAQEVYREHSNSTTARPVLLNDLHNQGRPIKRNTSLLMNHEPAGSEINQMGIDFKTGSASNSNHSAEEATRLNQTGHQINFIPSRSVETYSLGGRNENISFPALSSLAPSGASPSTNLVYGLNTVNSNSNDNNFYTDSTSENPTTLAGLQPSVSVLPASGNKQQQPQIIIEDPYLRPGMNVHNRIKPANPTKSPHQQQQATATTKMQLSPSTTISTNTSFTQNHNPSQDVVQTNGDDGTQIGIGSDSPSINVSTNSPGLNTSAKPQGKMVSDRLAFILIGGSCALSVVCLVLAAMSMRCQDICDDYRCLRNAERAALKLQKHRLKYTKSHKVNTSDVVNQKQSDLNLIGDLNLHLNKPSLDSPVLQNNNFKDNNMMNQCQQQRFADVQSGYPAGIQSNASLMNNIQQQQNQQLLQPNPLKLETSCKSALDIDQSNAWNNALVNCASSVSDSCICTNCLNKRLFLHEANKIPGGHSAWMFPSNQQRQSSLLHRGAGRLRPLFGAGSSVGTFFPQSIINPHGGFSSDESGLKGQFLLDSNHPLHSRCLLVEQQNRGLTKAKSLAQPSGIHHNHKKSSRQLIEALASNGYDLQESNLNCIHPEHQHHRSHICHLPTAKYNIESSCSDVSDLTIDDSIKCSNGNHHHHHHHHHQTQQQKALAGDLNNRLKLIKFKSNNHQSNNHRPTTWRHEPVSSRKATIQNSHHQSQHHAQALSSDSSSIVQCTCSHDQEPLLDALDQARSGRHRRSSNKLKELRLRDLKDKQQARRDKSMLIWSTNRDRLI